MTGNFGPFLPQSLSEIFHPGIVTAPKPVEEHLLKTVSKPTVLVVDDEGLIADSIAEILNGHGYHATAAYGGQAAIRLAEKMRPDLLLTDVLMPRINGIETAVRVSQLCEKTRILLFSGQAGTSDLLRSASSSGLSFELLPKPIHPQQLLRAIASMLRH